MTAFTIFGLFSSSSLLISETRLAILDFEVKDPRNTSERVSKADEEIYCVSFLRNALENGKNLLTTEKVLKELEEVSKEKRIAIEFKNENNKTFSVFGDADKLYEVVMNLLDNALKYSKTSPIAVTLKPRSKRLALAVADKGMGIPPDEMPKLFIKFGRTEIAKKERPEGMGLGLSLCRTVIEQHGGALTHEPAQPRGTVFRFTLPAA